MEKVETRSAGENRCTVQDRGVRPPSQVKGSVLGSNPRRLLTRSHLLPWAILCLPPAALHLLEPFAEVYQMTSSKIPNTRGTPLHLPRLMSLGLDTIRAQIDSIFHPSILDDDDSLLINFFFLSTSSFCGRRGRLFLSFNKANTTYVIVSVSVLLISDPRLASYKWPIYYNAETCIVTK